MKKYLLILLASLMLVGCGNTKNESLSEDVLSNASSIQTETTADETSVRQEELHEYYCDKFLLTVDGKQIDLTTVDPKLSSVSELYPIADDQLYILGRIDENYNALMVYDFTKEEIVFSEHGSTMCWVQGKFETVRYLKDNVVYDLDRNVIYQPDDDKAISMIEYVVEDFMITVTDSNYENPEEIWVE